MKFQIFQSSKQSLGQNIFLVEILSQEQTQLKNADSISQNQTQTNHLDSIS